MIVAGLDLSLRCTGLAVVSGSGNIETHRVRSTGRKNATVAQTAARINSLRWHIEEWLLDVPPEDQPDLAVIEAPSFNSKGGAAHERGGLWWGVAGLIEGLGIPIATCAPKTRAIYAVGHGKGTGKEGKREVYEAACKRYAPYPLVDDNEADALLLAAMGARWVGEPVDDVTEEKYLRAIGSVAWPK